MKQKIARMVFTGLAVLCLNALVVLVIGQGVNAQTNTLQYKQNQSWVLTGTRSASTDYQLLVNQTGRATVVTGRATCTGSATAFASASTKDVCFKNPGSTTVFLGGSDVAATTNYVQLNQYDSWCTPLSNPSAVYCITTGSSQVLPYIGTD